MLGHLLLNWTPHTDHRLEAGLDRALEDCWFAAAQASQRVWAGYRFAPGDHFAAHLEGARERQTLHGPAARGDDLWALSLDLGVGLSRRWQLDLGGQRWVLTSGSAAAGLADLDLDQSALRTALRARF